MTASSQRPDSTLGQFLRARRASISPRDAGLPPGAGPRRTPGLRREEVAVLAGISQNYYVRLERGSETHPSGAVLDALATALRLNPDEHEHLRRLAATSAGLLPTRSDSASRIVPEAIGFILEALRPAAAYVLNRNQDMLAANPAGLMLYPGMARWEPSRRNISRYLFLHPAARQLHPDTWDDQARHCIAGLRSTAGTHPDDAELAALVAELREGSADFARLWSAYDVRSHASSRKTLQHPLVGTITLGFQALLVEGTPGQRLSIFHAPPGTAAHRALVQLDAMGRTPESSTGIDSPTA